MENLFKNTDGRIFWDYYHFRYKEEKKNFSESL